MFSAAAAACVSLAAVSLFAIRARSALLDEARRHSLSLARAASVALSADPLASIDTLSQRETFESKRLHSVMRQFLQSQPEMRRIALIAERPGGGMTALADLRWPVGQADGAATDRARGELETMRLAFGVAEAERDVVVTASGAAVLQAYAPLGIADAAAGRAIVAVSIDAGPLRVRQRELLALALAAAALSTLLIVALGTLYIRKERHYTANAEMLKESKQDLNRMVQAEKELTRKNRELQVLSSISAQLAESFELSKNLHLSLERLLEIAGIDAAIVRMIDTETNELYLAAHRGLSPLLFEGYQRIPIESSFSGSVAASGEALFVENIPPTFGSAGQAPFDRRIRSYAIVPLKVLDRILGTMTLFSLSDPRFPSPYKDLVFSVAQQLAIAVENANLFERVKNRSAQLALIADISKRALVTMNVDSIVQMAIERIQAEFRYFFIAYYELDRDRSRFIRKAGGGGFFEMGYGEMSDSIAIGEGMASAACDQKRTVYVADAASEERFLGIPGNLTKSQLIVPVVIDGDAAGFFDLQSTMVKGFSGEDILMMETLADQIANTIRNRTLYARLQSSTQPAEAPVAAAPDPAQQPPAAPPAGGWQILVVDDEEYVISLLSELLGSTGDRVVAARNGIEAIEQFGKATFDLVFTDLGLPGMDGFELARALKRINPNAPVVLLTGYGAMVEDDALRHGEIDVVVSKPFTVQEIIECVKRFRQKRSGAGA